MLFPDPDAALQNALERIEELVTALANHRVSVYERLDALERNHDTNADTLSKVLSYFDDAPTPGANERERQARYWDTYNAALPEAMRVCRDENAGTNRLLDDVHELCTMHADRAHGPLEAAVPAVARDGLVGKTLIEAHGYLSRLFKSYAPQCEPLPDLLGVCTQIDNLLTKFRDVAALVRAANDVRAWIAYPSQHDKTTSGIVYTLDAAIKPFEEWKPTPISGAEFVDGMEEAINKRNTDVDALVKAALAGAAVLREYGGDYTAGDLEAACEPFSPPNTAHPSDFKPCPVAGCTLYVHHNTKCTGGEL